MQTENENCAFLIRPAGERDLPALIELLELLFDLEQDFQPDRERQQAGLRLMLGSPCAALLVAEGTEGVVAGFCGVQLLVSTAEGAYSAQIEDVVVAPGFRRRGLGRRLLDGAAAWARNRGATRLQLNCDDKNFAAMRFYEELGWNKTHLFNYFKFNF